MDGRSAGRQVRGFYKVFLGILCLLVLAALGFCGWAVWMLATSDNRDHNPYAQNEPALCMEKTSPGGVQHTINNSPATFRLDVTAPDKHGAKIFPDYASAWRYGLSAKLPIIPSVLVVHGKCKQFNDDLCATLEQAIQEGMAEKEILGKRKALTRLTEKLLKELKTTPEDRRRPVEAAVIHVAAALSLGGAEVQLPQDLSARVKSATQAFLDNPIESKPVGFWQRNDTLRAAFTQDRFLMQGLRISEDTGACIALAVAISGDPELAKEFLRFREFDAKLTNPSQYVRRDIALAPPARCVSFADLAALLPAGVPLTDMMEPQRIEQFQSEFIRTFGNQSGFALISYSQCKENDILYNLAGMILDAETTLELIIEAVEQGGLSLQPKPDSGWYDYQWYALETLLLPERARESQKLVLTEAYKERLRSAFKSAIAKDRETHIKHLPAIIACMSGDEVKPPRIEIGPQFSAEPTATVYLRTARGYRFLHTAMAAVLGENTLGSLARASDDGRRRDVDLAAELKTMALLLYGIYDRVSRELGQTPLYLPEEIRPDEIEKAKALASAWLSDPLADPDLSRDTRVAVPISHMPGGATRYWGTGGVRLERVKCKYLNEPVVEGVEPVFVPTFYYLPTDIPLEFERCDREPLTRDEFRKICDHCPDTPSLRRQLGAIEPGRYGGAAWSTVAVVAAILVGVCGIMWFGRKSPRKAIRRTLRLGLTAIGLLLAAWILALVFVPSYRTRFIVRHVASRHPGLAVMYHSRVLWPYAFGQQKPPPYMVPTLADLLSDPDPQVRYLAITYLWTISGTSDEDRLSATRRMEGALRKATDDSVPEVVQGALIMLGALKGEENVVFLRVKLRSQSDRDPACMGGLVALGEIGNATALDDVLPFTEDPRSDVRRTATTELGSYRDPRATRRILELLQSSDERTRDWALRAVSRHTERYPEDTEASALIDVVLLAAARNASFTREHRKALADHITDVPSRVSAYENLLVSPSPGKQASVDDCQIDAADSLGQMGPKAAPAIPTLKKVFEDPNADAKVRGRAGTALKRIQPEM